MDIALSRHCRHRVPDCRGVGGLHHFCRRLHFLLGKKHQRPEPARRARAPDLQHDLPAVQQPHRIFCRCGVAKEPGSPVLAVAGRDRIAGRHFPRRARRGNGISSSTKTVLPFAQICLVLRSTHWSVCTRRTSSWDFSCSLSLSRSACSAGCAKDTRNALRYSRSIGILWTPFGLWSSPWCTFSAGKESNGSALGKRSAPNRCFAAGSHRLADGACTRPEPGRRRHGDKRCDQPARIVADVARQRRLVPAGAAGRAPRISGGRRLSHAPSSVRDPPSLD